MDYYSDYDSIFSSFLGGFAIFAVFLSILVIAYIIVSIIANWKLYKKAGKGGWECIIPFYGYWVLVEIAGLEWWWFLLAMVDSIISLLGLENLSSIANLVSLFATFNIFYNIAKKFGKENGTAICAGIFSGIFVLIFGFSKNEVYNASIPVSKNGIFGTPEGNSSNNGDMYYQSNSTTQSTGVVDTVSNNTSSVDNENISNVNKEFSFCGNCGTKLEKDIRFCPNCGKENI